MDNVQVEKLIVSQEEMSVKLSSLISMQEEIA